MRRLRDEPNDDDDIPLHHKKPFGSGLKRKRVEFVRATESDNGLAATAQARTGPAIDELYASIVLGDGKSKFASAPATTRTSPQPEPLANTAAAPQTCTVCSLLITTPIKEHEASLSHQVKMTHAHPPSALDRTRMGLQALESQGWDPDARRGLGREGEGVRYPVKARAKHDTLGVGATVPEKPKQEEKPARKLTGKELKVAITREKKRTERLQAEIYGRVDVESYLRRQMDD
ncbi:hypothetical protein QQS21_001172 [Conoideocrella luteorostrata]|uniref:G-patch domain-containing protein n=1 Tax=Conoideocrella luteorostrata TaxID=1105319 RepID=A0AAJ0G3I4_9HYPO|nr:hypothetical protein QQS21_001172 [Conoideocrella luteorostrata]